LTSELLFGLIVLSLSFNASLDLNFASSILFFCLLFAIALFDLKFFLIPKNYLFVLILTSCVFALVNEYVVNFIFALFFTLSIWLMKYILDNVKKEETFGLGDVFIIFALGCYFEPILFSLIILTSALSGLVIFTIRFIFSNPEKKLPFGTLMALSAFSIEVLV
jgi:prepilin signal peptidase PulO-like enzyme (type II secretory pathway)